jgi:hypothetical protein
MQPAALHNGGSYRQVRSIAVESARAADARRRQRRRRRSGGKGADGGGGGAGGGGGGVGVDVGRGGDGMEVDDVDDVDEVDEVDDVDIDWFTLDFNEELSAFHGGLLDRQTRFAAAALRHVVSLYPRGSHVFVVGHSMGGVVARGALLALGDGDAGDGDGGSGDGDGAGDGAGGGAGPGGAGHGDGDGSYGDGEGEGGGEVTPQTPQPRRRNMPPVTLLTLATPHGASPAATQPAMARAYARLNNAWWGCASSMQLTHSLKGAWFQTLNL